MMVLSSGTYVIAVLFLLLVDVLFLGIVYEYSRTLNTKPLVEPFFRIFWLPTLFIVPLLTMKTFAESRRLGTLEPLMATLVRPWQVVVSKFLSTYSFYMILWSGALVLPFLLNFVLASEAQSYFILSFETLVGGYCFIAIVGAFYVALGIFASSLTRSQVTASMLTFSLLFAVLIGGRFLLEAPLLSEPQLSLFRDYSEYLQTFSHLDDFMEGVIDTRPVVLYLSSAFVILGITSWVIEAKA